MKKFLLTIAHATIGGALQALVASGVLPEPAITWKTIGTIAFTGAVSGAWQAWSRSPRDMWDGHTPRRKSDLKLNGVDIL